ncbi:uncharacterized protein LOC113874420 [Abrus precatorius]|uniref:Uncharacterized protein LOC113874420 n=1 Tax=Abrus precatorius TaxID=3816 RepID=A0A8B8MKL4_ABRPR|nr:uncharacterized protein LOC113874420 [Abrus precatorius]
MDIEDVKCHGNGKRKRGSKKRKLLVDERVEVKSVEEGFLGSWHPGTVIRCGRKKRHVRYDNILDDKGLYYLVDVVIVSSVLDDVNSSSDCCNRRGFIRPVPPPFEFGENDLPFALCVDVNYQDAWWEGVIFDHSNGMKERSVFFPDLGDEIKVGTDQLRITQDWDEASEEWEPRGKWVFLQLIEECERTSYIPVSVKQIWYDIRERKDFDNIRDWTCKVQDLWREPVMEVIGDYYTLTLEQIFPALNLPKDFFKEPPQLESVEPTDNVHCDASKDNVFGSDIGVSDCPMENGDSSNLLDSDKKCNSIIPIQEEYDKNTLVDETSEKEILLQEEPVSSNQEVLPDAGKVIPGASSCGKKRKRRDPTSLCWHPLIMTEVEFCPEIINEYLLGCGSKTIRDLLKTRVRKHLAYVGWKIEWTDDKYFPGRKRFRYKSPDTQDQKIYTSLVQVLTDMQKESNMNSVLPQIDYNRMHYTNDNNISHLLSDQPQNDHDLDVCPPNGAPSPSKVVDEPEFCPHAVVKYYLNESDNHRGEKGKWKIKAQRHLLAEGWVLDYPTEKRRRTLYRSPQNQCLGSLRGACRLYIKEKIPEWTTSGLTTLNVPTMNEEIVGHVDNEYLLQSLSQLLQIEPELQTVSGSLASGSTENRNHKRTRNSKASMPKHHRKGSPTRVLRSSKRVQKVSAPSLIHQRPQNVLSWLIDSNMVLPRCKVYCRAGGGRNPDFVAEGRITREGIKCSCCKKIYGLGGFVHHASGSSDCRPSASIFLRDGRSLLDCMIQVMHDCRTRETMEKACNDHCDGENDNVCSVCQYGGELILCDQCPSSFHKECLGMADIPDGDWFCPSCRCGICSQIKMEGTEHGLFLTCVQCERKYHDGCLEDRGKDESRKYMKNWFCGKECEQIYEGLQNLIGKPITVGGNNLTWTLMKCINSGSCDVDSTKNDLLAETYSKLNVALSVMHECFEPLENPFSGRDIIDDVIFNNRSELKRLNFQGFYSVLLERNEELISVATIRVFGQKVAEVPLVGTRLQYRRLGMCRILMDELEKKLMHLGVERLVLPAVPGVLETWTNSFGFEKMTIFERSQYVDYSFLDFQGTVMCQKLLTRIPYQDPVITETPTRPLSVYSVKCKIEFEKSSSVSEVDDQVEEIHNNGMMDLQVVEYVSPMRTS